MNVVVAGKSETKSGVGRTIVGLTGLRGLAALWVVLFHFQSSSNLLGLSGFDWQFAKYGWAGVDLFFILSGFVLMYAHHKHFQQLNLTRTLEFYRLRFFRVYPLATVVLMLIFGVVALVPGFAAWYRDQHYVGDYTLVPFFRTLTLSTRWFPPFVGDWNQPVWSLSAEIVGYVAFPVLALVLIRFRSLAVTFAALVASIAAPIAIYYLLGTAGLNNIGGLALIRMGGFFTAGLALYRVFELTRSPAWLNNSLLLVSMVVLGTGVALGVPVMMVPGFAALIYAVACGSGQTRAIFENPVVEFFGRISFPLYLVHQTPILVAAYAASSYGLGVGLAWVIAAASFAFSVMISWGLNTLVENPAHKWAKRRYPITMPVTTTSRFSS